MDAGIDEAHESSRSLNFVQRLNIAIDISSALEYLHCGCRTPILHCDLKPSNVLLDVEMTGHVGDFGLARFFPEATNNLSFNQSNTNGVRGTIGYTAPEYGMGNAVSTSGDAFSYGILLLEMFTGKRPTDEIFKDSLNLHTYVKAAFPKQVREILDAVLVQEIEGETGGHSQVQDCVVSVFEVGIACSAALPCERMDISEVTVELLAIKEKLLRSDDMGTHEVQVVLQP
ncbi:LRR receptor serine/threonine-protein kinase [Salix suchowensis]|nr:LRR receptor serine/threonine-protein kinase [Salix suchowensis]